MNKNLNFSIRYQFFKQKLVVTLFWVLSFTVGFANKVKSATFSLPISSAANATGVTEIRDLYGLDGRDIKVGVLSETFDTAQFTKNPPINNKGQVDNYAFDIKQGYLPPDVQVIADFKTPEAVDEGRAILETIHAVAPGASLVFYSFPEGAVANATPEILSKFSTGIQALESAGAQIIVDDVEFLNDPMPPDGPVNQAIKAAYNQGISYFTSAGNSYPTPIVGHPNNPDAVAVGAVYYGNQNFSPISQNTTQGQLEPYSSAGSPPFAKPDIVAPDGLDISFNIAGMSPSDPSTGLFLFFGTSQSAPYAAGVAALLLQAEPSTSPSRIYEVLRDTAQPLDSEIPGFNYQSGYGLIRADKALSALELNSVAVPEPTSDPMLLTLEILITLALVKCRKKRCP